MGAWAAVSPARAVATALSLLALTACPPVNSTPCATDNDCTSEQRCRRGACGPICLADTDCGSGQVCNSKGVCAARPECSEDTDCAQLFTCVGGRCSCSQDAACAANETCIQGTCTAQERCNEDSDCAGSGKRCEVSQGVCLPVCTLPTDCAPNLSPQVAFGLYSCVQGTCMRRCLNDLTCGGQGLICKSGLCGVADCKTLADCPAGQYCTSATFGRCMVYTTCTTNAQCEKNFECSKFNALQCPPGFNCNQAICQELQRCFIDGDCQLPNQDPAYCGEGHCQPTVDCKGGLPCPAGLACVAELCVPGACRGHAECGAGKVCSDGACSTEPIAEEIYRTLLTPKSALLEVGDTLKLTLVAFRLNGSSAPMSTASFTVEDELGAPSALATVTPSGLVTAVGPGKIVVKAQITGSGVQPESARITIFPAVTAGRRVIVIDEATRAPLPNVKVFGCLASACTAPTEVTSNAEGIAEFAALGAGAAHFTAVDQQVRTGDGKPKYERVSFLGTNSDDVLLPLRPNPVHAAAGFNASISFLEVHTGGQYWAGYALGSASDVASLDLAQLLGDTFQVTLPGLGQAVPVPSSVVLYTSPGFGIPQEVKPKSLAQCLPGNPRAAAAFAGRADLAQALALRSTEFLAYLGAFDYALNASTQFTSRARVPDTSDVDDDGLCSNPQKCPMGSEDVPDYANFTALQFTPNRQQLRRTEVVLPRLPSTLDTVVVAAIELTPESGMVPLGLTSRAAGAPAGDGTRPADPVVLRSGAPYGGVEASSPGIWALAANAGGDQSSGRLLTGPTLPISVNVPSFLPVPSGAAWSAQTKALVPQQPEWSNTYSAGGDLVRASVTGSDVRHTLYFAMAAATTSVAVPPVPTGPGIDPTGESGTQLEVVSYDLSAAVSVDDALSLAGDNLSNLLPRILGYSRWNR
jgi:hypothetical protein